MLDRIMQMLDVPRIPSTDLKADTGYYIKEVDGEFFRASCAASLAKLLIPQIPLSSQDELRLFTTALLRSVSLI
jgi:hypothetical protein